MTEEGRRSTTAGSSISRRNLLKGAVSLGLSIPAASALLEACGGGSPSSSASGGGNATVTVWTHTHPPMIQLMKTLISEYESKHPNIKIDYQTIPNAQFGAKMLTALSSGSGPDIINMDDGALRGDYIPKKLLVPVNPVAAGFDSLDAMTGKYIPGAFAGATGQDGKIYGIPLEYNAAAFAINATQMQEAGLDPSAPPKSWDEVATQAAKLVQRSGDRMTREGFDFLYIHAGWYMNFLQLLLHQTGGHILNAKQTDSVVAQAKSVQALSVWNDLLNKSHVGDPHVASNNATVPYADFYTGKLSSVIYTGPWAQQQMQQSYPDQYKQVKIAQVPQVDPSKPFGRAYGYSMAVNKASKVHDEAWKFIGYVTSQHDRWLSDVFFVQPVKNWQKTPAARKIDFIDVWTQAYATAKFDEVGPQWSQISDTLMSAVQATVFSGASPLSSFQKAQAQITQILQQAR